MSFPDPPPPTGNFADFPVGRVWGAPLLGYQTALLASLKLYNQEVPKKTFTIAVQELGRKPALRATTKPV